MRVGRWRPVCGAGRGRAGAGGEGVLLPSSSKFRVRGRGWGRGHKIKKISESIYIEAFQIFSGPNFSGFPFRFRSPPKGPPGPQGNSVCCPPSHFQSRGQVSEKPKTPEHPKDNLSPNLSSFILILPFLGGAVAAVGTPKGVPELRHYGKPH